MAKQVPSRPRVTKDAPPKRETSAEPAAAIAPSSKRPRVRVKNEKQSDNVAATPTKADPPSASSKAEARGAKEKAFKPRIKANKKTE